MASPLPPPDLPPREQPGGLARLIALNASALTVGRLVNAGLGIVGLGITTRYLGADLFGTLVTITAFTTLLMALTDMGVWTIGARELAKRPADSQRLLNSLFTIGIGLSLFSAVIGLALAFAIYPGPGGRLEREGIALLILLPLPLGAAAMPAGAYLIAQQRGYAAAVAGSVASVAMTLIVVLAVILDLGFTAIVLANAVQSIAFAVVILAYTLPHVRFRPSWEVALSRQLLRWALPLGAALILTSLYWRIDIVLLSLIGESESVGIFGLAYKVVDTLYVLPTFVMLTLLPEFARLADNPARRDELVQKASTVMQVAIVALLVFTVAFAEEIVALAGGKEFDDAAVVLQILMLGVAAGFLRAVFTDALIAANRQVWLMYATGALLAVNVALNLALIPWLGARGAATAFAISEIAALIAVALLFRRIGTLPRPHRLARLLVAGAAMGVVTLLRFLPLADTAGPVAVLAVLGALSIAVYTAVLYALGAMPREVHSTLIAPLLVRLRRQD